MSEVYLAERALRENARMFDKKERESSQLLGSDTTSARIAVGTRQAAYLAGVSERTIQSYVAAKLLPSRKIGKRRLILVRDLEKFLCKNQPLIVKPNEHQDSASELIQPQVAEGKE